ncbi:MAG: ABC transporter substrate-binding protein [Acidimicrobiales bacterium]|nr:ABC transporter substrate-binding protein [Acidimicrobiales bacterium]
MPHPILSRRRFLGLAAGAAAAGPALLTACSGGGSGDRVVARHRDGILRIGVAGAPTNINPIDSGSEQTRWPAEAIVETLYAYDDDLASVPLLADGEPIVSADRLTWTIKLKKGIKFHNGDELRADDVIATLDHILDLGSGSEWITYLLDYVQRFDKVDDHTLSIGLVRPYGLLRSHLTNLPITHRDFAGRRDTIMGTGPFRLDGHRPGQSYTLSRFDGYHGEQSEFEGIEYTVFADGATRLVSLRQGKVDLITAVPFQNLGAVERDDDLKLVVADSPLDVLTYVNLHTEPFSDREFRLAVAHSMDRAGVRDRVYAGHATIGQGPIGPAELGWDPDLDVFGAERDLDRARDHLAKAETDVRKFKVTIGTGQTSKEIAAVLVAGWAEIGIDVEILPLAGGPWSSAWLANDYEMLMNTFQSGFTSGPANYLTLAPAHSRNILSCGYVDPDVDAWMDSVWETDVDAERVDALGKINRRLAEEAVIFPPVYPKLAMAQRVELSPLDRERLRISRIEPQHLHFVEPS